jgi:hypothetical protein
MKTIKLTNGEIAMVDDIDYDELNKWRWSISGGYALRRISRVQVISMHRDILMPKDDKRVDHINGNKLDNQRHNLRIATHSQNMQNFVNPKNTSGFRGVSYNVRLDSYQAEIRCDGKRKYLGVFKKPENAARAYDKAALELFGPNALTNIRLGLLSSNVVS